MTVRKSAARKTLAGTARGDRPPRIQPTTNVPKAASDPLSPPDSLSDGAKVEWAKLAPVALALRTLTGGDLRAFALLCECLATGEEARRNVAAEGFTVGTADGGRKPHPCVRIMETARNQASRLLHAFGLTPQGRAALDLQPQPFPGVGTSELEWFLATDPDAQPKESFEEFPASKPPVTR